MYYLLGTPVIWWGSTFSLFVALGVYLLRSQRKYIDMDAPKSHLSFLHWNMVANETLKGEWDHFLYVGKITFYLWAFHFW